jgi:hypothetical protein
MLKNRKGVNVNKLDRKLNNMLSVFERAVIEDFEITSAYRTPEENAEVGGVPESSHLKGLAVDIACSDSINRFKIVFGALASGFKRIGLAKDHVHLDCDIDKVQPVIFFD